MNYIKMSPIAGMTGYGGGAPGLTLVGAGASVEGNFGDRAITAGGRSDDPSYPTYHNIVDYYSISSVANGSDFGDLSAGRSQLGSCSSGSRAFVNAGYDNGANKDTIDFLTVSTTGNATDYGNLTSGRRGGASASSLTRGVHGGGNDSNDTIDYWDLSTSSGNATDFGNLINGRESVPGCSDLDRALFGGGYGNDTDIDYITIANTGNATDFGNLSDGRTWASSTCDLTRAVFCGGAEGSSQSSVIDYVTVQTTGNATDFGDMTSPTKKTVGVCTDGTKAMMNCGYNQSSNTYYTDIDHITIQTTGNATDSGYNLTHTRGYTTSTSGD